MFIIIVYYHHAMLVITLCAHRSLFCVALFFMCAALGVWGANLFVNKIYRNVKID